MILFLFFIAPCSDSVIICVCRPRSCSLYPTKNSPIYKRRISINNIVFVRIHLYQALLVLSTIYVKHYFNQDAEYVQKSSVRNIDHSRQFFINCICIRALIRCDSDRIAYNPLFHISARAIVQRLPRVNKRYFAICFCDNISDVIINASMITKYKIRTTVKIINLCDNRILILSLFTTKSFS